MTKYVNTQKYIQCQNNDLFVKDIIKKNYNISMIIFI